MTSFQQFPFFASFVAGILTFISPCILPLIPAYISFITGASLEELRVEGTPFRHTFWNAFFFVMGFSVVFVLLGASASYLGNLIYEYRNWLRYLGGALVILFGLHLSGLVRIPLFYHEKTIQMGKVSVHHLRPFIIGLAFAIGWTPCVGPILSSILILAATQETVYRGMLLLAVYAAGLGIPFLLTAVFINTTLRFFSKIKRYYHGIEIASGVILILVGVLIMTDSFKIIAGYTSGFLG